MLRHRGNSKKGVFTPKVAIPDGGAMLLHNQPLANRNYVLERL